MGECLAEAGVFGEVGGSTLDGVCSVRNEPIRGSHQDGEIWVCLEGKACLDLPFLFPLLLEMACLREDRALVFCFILCPLVL